MPDDDGWLTEQDLADLSGAAQNLFLAAVDDDIDQVGAIVATVGERFGHDGVLSLCDALANAAKHMSDMTDDYPRLRIINERTGRPVEPEDVPPQAQADVWAMRFVAAWIGGGPAATRGLFYAYLHDQDRTLSNVAALVHLVGDVGRARLAENEAG